MSDRQLKLGEVIAFLQQYPADTPVNNGFGAGMSYRGYNDQIAFAPEAETTTGTMLAFCHARKLDGPMNGFKGNVYPVNDDALCNIAEYGEVGPDDEDWITEDRLLEMVDPTFDQES